MLSENPGIPGRRAQMPRTTSVIFTPACDARYNASISLSSSSEFIFAQMLAGFPFFAYSISLSISFSSLSRKLIGAIDSFFKLSGCAYPVR